VVLAGGLGTRMRAHQPGVPKSLLEVAGRPFAHWQLEWLAGQGVDEVVFSIGHLGDLIEEVLGSGDQWGVAIRYLREEEGSLLGTGGAVRSAVDSGLVGSTFFVLYGDSYLDVNLREVDRALDDALAAVMTVFENRSRWDASNVVVVGDRVARYEKGLANPPADMTYIDYGVSVVTATSVTRLIPPEGASDLAPYFSQLAAAGQLGAFVAKERFYEVGSPEGLVELDRHLRQ
jgi:NDP-sugar pyrophosphorylase family protein